MADEIREFDLTVSEDRFRWEVNRFVIGQEISAVIVRPDRVELHLSNERVLTFSTNGQDILIHIPVERVQPLETGRVM